MSIILKKIEEHYKRNLPFVVYRKPNSNLVSGFFMYNDELNLTIDFKEIGFVFAPFDSKEKAILFPKDKSDFLSENIMLDNDFTINTNFENLNNEVKEEHIKLVEKTIEEIDDCKLKKVVVSRKEEVQLDNFNLLITYKKLLNIYKNAFVYVWFHPKVGLWFGATPEMLLNISDTSFKTMSLAGTQVYKGSNNIIWKPKELKEQQLVTDFIESQLNSIAINLKIADVETVKAGNLLHLKTKVKGDLNAKESLKELIRALHPTPAVCGLPREKAKKFIDTNENYKRTFYTGFLGELNLNNLNSSLFVNLRCMNVKNKIASIYIGGGITKDSDANKEWEETVAKSNTMKGVL